MVLLRDLLLRNDEEALMDDIEIVFNLFDSSKINSFFEDVLTFKCGNIINAHFYDDLQMRDVTYDEIDDLCGFFSKNVTPSSMFLDSINCGIEIHKVVICIVQGFNGVEISLNIKKCDFRLSLNECMNFVRHLYNSILSGTVNQITFGYEPAKDDDMRILAMTVNDEVDIHSICRKLFGVLNS